MLVFSKITTKSNGIAARALALFLCVAISGLWSLPAYGITRAGTTITHPKATLTSTSSGGITQYSNQPSADGVDAYYGLDDTTFSEGEDVGLLLEGEYTDYEIGIENKGNATDSIRLEIGAQTQGGNGGDGAAWSVEALDSTMTPLTWEVGGAYSDAAGDAATATAIGPWERATFTLRVRCTSGAPDGATMTFSVALKTLGTPAGTYSGYNGVAYGGPNSAISNEKTAQVPDNNPPVVTITSPVEGASLTSLALTVAGATSPPAASGTISVGGFAYPVTIDSSGDFSHALSLPAEGSNVITVTAFDESHNSSSDTVTVFVDSLSPELAFLSPAEDAAVSGVVSISGTAYDANFASYTLYYGPGESPVAWGVVATDSVTIADNVLGAWDTLSPRVLFGTYTLKLASTDNYGHFAQTTRTVIVGNAISLTGTLPKGEWTMVSLPGLPNDPEPSSFLGTNRYEVQQWDPTIETDDPYLHKYRQTFALDNAGEGFWVKPYEEDIDYSVTAAAVDTTTKYTIALKVGWNQIGNPFNTGNDMLWSLVTVKNVSTGESKSTADAITAGWIDSGLNEYSDNGYETRGLGDPLTPFVGYFVKANEECELEFDPAPGRAMARIVRPQYSWRMRVSAETSDARDVDNFAAELMNASDEFDGADASEPPTVEPFVSLYFENEGWERNPGRYAGDTRAPAASIYQVKTWNFVVEVSRPGEEVKISMESADSAALPENYDYVIRDNLTGEEFDPRQMSEYTYLDDGTAKRSFSLRSMRTGDADLITLSKIFPAGWSLFSVPLEPAPTDVRLQLGNNLDNIQAFQYYDRELYEPESPEMVDVQAGIGYWIHLKEEQELDFEGVSTGDVTAIEVPLVMGWNLIGNPYEREVEFGASVSIVKGGETLPLAEAVEAQWIAPEIYAYNNEIGGYERLEVGSPLVPWRGYAVKALIPCTIIINAEP